LYSFSFSSFETINSLCLLNVSKTGLESSKQERKKERKKEKEGGGEDSSFFLVFQPKGNLLKVEV